MKRARHGMRSILASSALLTAVLVATPGAATCSFYREPGFSGLSLTLNPDMREEKLRAFTPTIGSLKASRGCRAVLIGEKTQAFSGEARRVSEPFRSKSTSVACDCGAIQAPAQPDEPVEVEAKTETKTKTKTKTKVESRSEAEVRTETQPKPESEAKQTTETEIKTAPKVAEKQPQEKKPVVDKREQEQAREVEAAREESLEPPQIAYAPSEAPRPGAAEKRRRYAPDPEPDYARAEPAPVGGFEGCRLFTGRGFGGDLFEMAPDESLEDLRRYDMDNAVASVSTSPDCEIALYSHPGFRGPERIVSGDAAELGSDMSRHASSASCDCGGYGREAREAAPPQRDPALERYAAAPGPADFGGMRPPPPVDARGAACLAFGEPGYEGRWVAYRGGAEDQDLGRDLSQALASVEVARGCVAVLHLGGGITAEIETSLDWLDRRTGENALALSCYCR